MKKQFFLPLILALVAVTFSCTSPTQNVDDNIISVSVLPQKYFVEALVNDKTTVNVMIPAGASPASYEPTPKQMTELARSKVYLKIGHLGYEEAWMPRIQKAHPDIKVVDLSKGIELITEAVEDDHDHEAAGDHSHGVDPHIWMSPKTAKIMVKNMASALIKVDPACQALINQRKDSLMGLIDALDHRFEEELKEASNRKFIIFHPALSYLARDYNYEQISMEFQGKVPSAAHLKSIVDRSKNENIKHIFIQREFDQKNAQQLAKETGAEVIQIDPLSEDWMGQMETILMHLKSMN